MKYIVVQAGGKGTRLKDLTKNKPKALVPIDNLPMLFHLFRKYPDKLFVVIADYKEDVMRRYLHTFADVKNVVVSAAGAAGTCSGVGKALEIIPDDEPFMLMWSDLILGDDFTIPSVPGNYIGLSDGFTCRWKYESNVFSEVPSDTSGVAGLFIFSNKKKILDVPGSGEFVRWLSTKDIAFETIRLKRTKEYGILENIDKVEGGRCRPFNKMTIDGDRIIKEGIDAQGRGLAVREKAWYVHAQHLGFTSIPKIYSFEPFIMERIDGKNVFQYELSPENKMGVLKKIVDSLKDLHSLETTHPDAFSLKDAYFSKTLKRLNTVRDLIPHANEEIVIINGKECRNIFWNLREVEDRLEKNNCDEFNFIHGDCTFSNIMLRNGMEPVLIDPRGYFGYTELYGDPLYDWSKLYYSLCGNYDQFNLKRFSLNIDKEISLNIRSNGWEDMEEDFFKMLPSNVDKQDVKMLHAMIWLSLTTYAWEDYDSICGAFYNGLYHLEDVL